jgi:DNA-binding Xre family transcriptional regulator
MKIDNVMFDVALARCQKNNKGIAAELGVTPGAIHFMRYKTTNLRPETAGKLAQALGVDVCDIIERSKDFVPTPLPAPPAPAPTAQPTAPVAATPRTLLTEAQFEQFARFWEIYPKKMSKGQAMKAWKTVNPNGTLTEMIIDAVKRAMTDDDRFTHNPKFTPFPATWLNACGWDDKPPSGGTDGKAQKQSLMEQYMRIHKPKNEEAVNVGLK